MTNFPIFNQNTTGSAAKWTTARNLAGNSVDGSANVAFSNAFVAAGTGDSGLSGAQFLGALGTGILKNTTSTGVLSIATAADFPTLNQNTTGNAATATTASGLSGSPNIAVSAVTATSITGSSLNQTAALAFGGTCPMSSSASCTATIGHSYSTPACIVSAQGTTGGTFLAARCSVSGAVVTITASATNSQTWDFLVFGNPN